MRFLGLYDPVDMVAGWGEGETVSDNVQYAYAIYAAFPKASRTVYDSYKCADVEGTRSRCYFNRADAGAENATTNTFIDSYVWATHGAIGGAPWDGDHPDGHSQANDIRFSILADRLMRMHALWAGIKIPLSQNNEYGY